MCRKANNRESARRTRAKKSNRMAELDEENCQLRAQLAPLQAQIAELQTMLANLPQISPHQRCAQIQDMHPLAHFQDMLAHVVAVTSARRGAPEA